MSRFIDITGQKFGRLTALRYAESRREKNGEKTAYWWFQCDCGKEIVRRKSHVVAKKGGIKSCGCLLKDAGLIHRVHGGTGSKLHNIWMGMFFRCENEKSDHWANYGGRGIKICPEWHDFITFRDWALSNGYQDSLTIDRIDVNGNYEPPNCRWATMKEQQNNKRTNRFITCGGETLTATQWAERLGGHLGLVLQRLKRGWNEIAAVATPLKKYRKGAG
jgi:hypothetical protein